MASELSDSTSTPEPLAGLDAAPAATIAELVRERRFCAAARLYSEQTGENLVESKLAIDRIAMRHGYAPLNGCASYLMLLIAAGGSAFWALAEVLLRLW